jgi:hypothetical protein
MNTQTAGLNIESLTGKQKYQICYISAEQQHPGKSADNAPADYTQGCKAHTHSNHYPEINRHQPQSNSKRPNRPRYTRNHKCIEDIRADQIANRNIMLTFDCSYQACGKLR